MRAEITLQDIKRVRTAGRVISLAFPDILSIVAYYATIGVREEVSGFSRQSEGPAFHIININLT